MSCVRLPLVPQTHPTLEFRIMDSPTDRPIIGDFKSKPGNTPRVAAPAPAPVVAPTATPAPAPEGTPEEELTPVERYRQRLERVKISLVHALEIYDAVFDKGYYEEYVRIRSKRAVLRTRSYED